MGTLEHDRVGLTVRTYSIMNRSKTIPRCYRFNFEGSLAHVLTEFRCEIFLNASALRAVSNWMLSLILYISNPSRDDDWGGHALIKKKINFPHI